MASWSNTTIAEPFRNLYYDYQPEAESVWNDTTNRIRQSAAQGMASEGLPAKGPAYQARVNTGVTNAGVARAKQEQAAKLAHTQTMTQLPTTPPIASSLFSPLASSVGKELGPAIGQGLAGGVSKLWGMGSSQLGKAYEALTAPPYDAAWQSAHQAGVPYPDYAPTASPTADAFSGMGWGEFAPAAEATAPLITGAVSEPDMWTNLVQSIWGI